MELYHEAIDHEESLVHEWRVTQLRRPAIPGPLAEAEADNVDWHQIARLIQRGCSPRLALRIVRGQLPRKVSREVASGSYRCRTPCDLGSMVGGEDERPAVRPRAGSHSHRRQPASSRPDRRSSCECGLGH